MGQVFKASFIRSIGSVLADNLDKSFRSFISEPILSEMIYRIDITNIARAEHILCDMCNNTPMKAYYDGILATNETIPFSRIVKFNGTPYG